MLVKQKIIKSSLGKMPEKNELFILLKNKYKTLLFNKKILLFVSFFFLIAFFININNTKKNNQVEINVQKYKNLSQTIEQKQNQAEANLLYSNNEGAKKLFDEISSLLKELPQQTEEQQNKYQDFKSKFDDQLEKIRRVVKIDDAQELTDFNNLNSRSQVENISYIPSANRLYAADPSLKSVYLLDLNDNISTTITDLEHPIQKLNFPSIYNNNDKEQIFYFNNNNIITLDTKEDVFSTIEINLKNFQSIGGADIYNSKLYTIDTDAGQIYRFSKTDQGFKDPVSWLSEKIDLSQAISLSIDGHIYILNKDSTVLRLLSGHKTDFKLKICDPPLEYADKIIASKKFDFLYLLETKKNRLVVYDKTGQFLMQYQSEKLDHLKDFAIDEENKIIYFLNGSKILKFKATHLK